MIVGRKNGGLPYCGDVATSPRPTVVFDDQGFRSMVAAIVAEYRTVAPQVRDGSVVLAELSAPDDIVRRGDPGAGAGDVSGGSARTRVTTAGSPGPWVPTPPRLTSIRPNGCCSRPRRHPEDWPWIIPVAVAVAVAVAGKGTEATETDRPTAIIGLRPCDMAAAGVLDRVLGRGTLGGD